MAFLFVFLLGILITFFAWWPWAEVTFEVPKVFAFSLFVKALFLLFVFDLYKYRGNLKNWNIDPKMLVLILAFLVWVNIVSLIGLDPAKSFLGNFYRRDGLIMLFDLACFSFLISYFWKKKFNEMFSGTIFVSGFILGTWALALFLKGNLSLGNAASFGNPVFLAGFLSVSLPFSFYYISTFKSSYKYLLLIPQVISIFLMAATSAVLTVGLWFVLLILTTVKNLKIPLIVLISTCMLIVAGVWIRNYISLNSQSLIAEGRVRIFANLWEGVSKRPIVGYGWSNVDYAFEQGSWPLKLNNDVYVDKAHSHILEMLVTTGIVGMLIYICFLISLFWNLNNRYKKEKVNWNFVLISVFILFVFHSQTNVISVTEEVLFSQS